MLRQAAAAALVIAQVACATSPPPATYNHDLIESVHAAVPESWRTASMLTPDVNPLETSEELKAFVRKHAAGKASAKERMLALAKAVFSPDGLALTYNESATYTAAEAFAMAHGNCMGFSNLMVAAARELDISADYELMSNYSGWQRQGDLLVRTMHVRVVSQIRDQKLVFDFFPDPVSPGSWSRPLDDSQALAHHLNNLGAEYMQNHDLQQAYGYLHKALKTSPGLSFLWSNLGALLSRQNMTAFAEASYKEAMRLDPDQLTAVSNLHRLYERTGQDTLAAALAAQVTSYRERNPFYHFWLAEQAYENDQHETAEKHYRRAIKLKNDERIFYVGLARAYYKQNKILAARKAINKSHRLFSREADTVTVRPRRR
ncbi:MAG: hypothetical protein HKN59_06630 [Gammaproteobacteria bacterium]|nr:hypothetical protein [Gammaproteobacteria bacterium]